MSNNYITKCQLYFCSEVPQAEAKHMVKAGQQEGGHMYTHHVWMRVAWTNKGNSWRRQMRWAWVHCEGPQAEAKHRVNAGQWDGGCTYTQHVQTRAAHTNKGNSWHRQTRWAWVQTIEHKSRHIQINGHVCRCVKPAAYSADEWGGEQAWTNEKVQGQVNPISSGRVF